jgi:hypothetical protein
MRSNTDPLRLHLVRRKPFRDHLHYKTEESSVTYIHAYINTNSAFCDGKATVWHTGTLNDDMLNEYYNFRTQGGGGGILFFLFQQYY